MMRGKVFLPETMAESFDRERAEFNSWQQAAN
jgi:hypothetical protein